MNVPVHLPRILSHTRAVDDGSPAGTRDADAGGWGTVRAPRSHGTRALLAPASTESAAASCVPPQLRRDSPPRAASTRLSSSRAPPPSTYGYAQRSSSNLLDSAAVCRAGRQVHCRAPMWGGWYRLGIGYRYLRDVREPTKTRRGAARALPPLACLGSSSSSRTHHGTTAHASRVLRGLEEAVAHGARRRVVQEVSLHHALALDLPLAAAFGVEAVAEQCLGGFGDMHAAGL